MAFAWQTIEEAAVTLKISTRTIHRRISGGELQTRLENGRREVMVSVPDESQALPFQEGDPADSSISQVSQPPTRVETSVSDAVVNASDGNGQTALALTEDRFRRAELALTAYQHSLTMAEDAARRARAGTCFAWVTTGVLVTLIVLATAWTTHRVTQASADMERLSGEVHRLSDVADARAKDLERVTQEKEDAKVATARLQGKMMRPTEATTQPASIFEKMAGIFGGK